MKYLAIALCLVTGGHVFAADALSGRGDMGALVEAVMQDVGAGRMAAGVARLRAHSVLAPEEFDAQVAKFEAQFSKVTEQFGKPVGYDFVEVQERGAVLAQYIYLQTLEKHPMIWRFLFYKPGETWLVNTWYLDHKISSLFNP